VKNDGCSQDGYRVPLIGENDIDRVMDGAGGKDLRFGTEPGKPFKQLDVFIRHSEVRLKEVASVIAGSGKLSPKTKPMDVQGGIHPVVMVADLARKHVDYCLTTSQYKLTDRAVKKKKPYCFRKGTVLVPVTGKASLKNHRALLGMSAYATSTIVGVESIGKLHPFCLFHFFLRYDMEEITYDLGYPGVSVELLSKVFVPNYSDREQHDIIQRVSECVELSGKLANLHEINIRP